MHSKTLLAYYWICSEHKRLKSGFLKTGICFLDGKDMKVFWLLQREANWATTCECYLGDDDKNHTPATEKNTVKVTVKFSIPELMN
nr:hypothetical protein [uncultured Desulfuromonas sp.]